MAGVYYKEFPTDDSWLAWEKAKRRLFNIPISKNGRVVTNSFSIGLEHPDDSGKAENQRRIMVRMKGIDIRGETALLKKEQVDAKYFNASKEINAKEREDKKEK